MSLNGAQAVALTDVIYELVDDLWPQEDQDEHTDVHYVGVLVELKAELDRLIAEHVEMARTDDVPWSVIAAKLGTTRQAAQQRFGSGAIAE